MESKQYHRGDIVYIFDNMFTTGSEIRGDRPAVVVSRDRYNQCSQVIEVVYLTTAAKKLMQTHVPVLSSGRLSTAVCEQISSVDKSRIGKIHGKCTEQEMISIDQALHYSLALE